MKKLNFAIIFSCLLISLSCTTVMKKIYGIKNPEFETHEKILNFQEEIGFGGIPYLGLKPEFWRNNQPGSFVDMFVFNELGKYIPYRDSLKPNCNGPAELFLAELNTEKEYHFSDKYNLKSFMELMEKPQCQPLVEENYQEVDFYVFMTFATFSGKKLYEEKSKVWYESLRQNKNIRYKLIMINLDLKECWSPEQKSWLESKGNH